MLITTPDGVGAAPYRVLLLSASVQPSVGRLCSHRQLVTIIIYTIVCTNIALARSFPQLHVSINIQFHMSLFSILHMCLANVLSFLLFTPLPSLSFPLTMIIIVASNIISSKSPRDTWGWKQGRVWEKRRWNAQVGKIQFETSALSFLRSVSSRWMTNHIRCRGWRLVISYIVGPHLAASHNLVLFFVVRLKMMSITTLLIMMMNLLLRFLWGTSSPRCPSTSRTHTCLHLPLLMASM